MGRTCFECAATYGWIYTLSRGARHAERATTLRPPPAYAAARINGVDACAAARDSHATGRAAQRAWPRRS